MGNTTSSPAGASGVHGYEDWNDQLKRDDSVDHAYASVLASSTAAAAAAALAAETAVATSGLTSNYIASRNQQKQQQQQQQQQQAQQKLQQQAYAYQQQQHQQQQQQQQYHHMYGQQAHMMHHGHALPPAAAFSQQQQQLQLVVNGTGAEVRRGQGQLQQQQQQQQALNGNQMTDGSSPTTVHPTRSRSLDGRSSEKRPSIRRRRRLPGVVGPDGVMLTPDSPNPPTHTATLTMAGTAPIQSINNGNNGNSSQQYMQNQQPQQAQQLQLQLQLQQTPSLLIARNQPPGTATSYQHQQQQQQQQPASPSRRLNIFRSQQQPQQQQQQSYLMSSSARPSTATSHGGGGGGGGSGNASGNGSGSGSGSGSGHVQMIRDIGMPTDVVHGIHIEYDAARGKLLGVPDVWSSKIPTDIVDELLDTEQLTPHLVPPPPSKDFEGLRGAIISRPYEVRHKVHVGQENVGELYEHLAPEVRAKLESGARLTSSSTSTSTTVASNTSSVNLTNTADPRKNRRPPPPPPSTQYQQSSLSIHSLHGLPQQPPPPPGSGRSASSSVASTSARQSYESVSSQHQYQQQVPATPDPQSSYGNAPSSSSSSSTTMIGLGVHSNSPSPSKHSHETNRRRAERLAARNKPQPPLPPSNDDTAIQPPMRTPGGTLMPSTSLPSLTSAHLPPPPMPSGPLHRVPSHTPGLWAKTQAGLRLVNSSSAMKLGNGRQSLAPPAAPPPPPPLTQEQMHTLMAGAAARGLIPGKLPLLPQQPPQLPLPAALAGAAERQSQQYMKTSSPSLHPLGTTRASSNTLSARSELQAPGSSTAAAVAVAAAVQTSITHPQPSPVGSVRSLGGVSSVSAGGVLPAATTTAVTATAAATAAMASSGSSSSVPKLTLHPQPSPTLQLAFKNIVATSPPGTSVSNNSNNAGMEIPSTPIYDEMTKSRHSPSFVRIAHSKRSPGFDKCTSSSTLLGQSGSSSSPSSSSPGGNAHILDRSPGSADAVTSSKQSASPGGGGRRGSSSHRLSAIHRAQSSGALRQTAFVPPPPPTLQKPSPSQYKSRRSGSSAQKPNPLGALQLPSSSQSPSSSASTNTTTTSATNSLIGSDIDSGSKRSSDTQHQQQQTQSQAQQQTQSQTQPQHLTPESRSATEPLPTLIENPSNNDDNILAKLNFGATLDSASLLDLPMPPKTKPGQSLSSMQIQHIKQQQQQHQQQSRTQTTSGGGNSLMNDTGNTNEALPSINISAREQAIQSTLGLLEQRSRLNFSNTSPASSTSNKHNNINSSNTNRRSSGGSSIGINGGPSATAMLREIYEDIPLPPHGPNSAAMWLSAAPIPGAPDDGAKDAARSNHSNKNNKSGGSSHTNGSPTSPRQQSQQQQLQQQSSQGRPMPIESRPLAMPHSPSTLELADDGNNAAAHETATAAATNNGSGSGSGSGTSSELSSFARDRRSSSFDSRTQSMGSTASRPVSRNNLGIEGLVVTKLNPAGAFADPPGLIKFAVGESGSELFKAVERLTSTTVAIKIVSTSMQEKMTEIVSELRLVGTRRHLNLVAMHTCVLTTDSLWSVCEYMEFGAVADALQVLDMLEMSEAVMARILRDAAQGIAFLNSVGLAHRDIRSDNLLVNAQGITKLTDMSHAAPLPLRLEALSVNGDDSTAASTAAAAIQYTTSRPMGAIYWLSPEATQRKPCDMTVDMWALGIVAYELMEGQPPHMEFPELKALYLISTNGAPPLKQNPDRCWSNEIRAFVAECTRFDCRQRPIAQDVLDMSEFLAEDRCASHMEVVEMMKKAQALVEELE